MYAADWSGALAALADADRAAVARGDRRAQARALVATSRVQLDAGLNRRADVSPALVPAQRALGLAEALGDRALVADALDRIGNVHY